MTLDHDPSTPRRVAALRLRAPNGTLAAQAYWPAAVWPTLLVAFGLPEDDAARLCVEAAVVVLAAAPGGDADACTALGWAADNLPDLSAHGPLLLAGAGAGADRARAAAAQAARTGWPALRHLFVVELETPRPPVSKSAGPARRMGVRPIPSTTITPGPDHVSELLAAIDRVLPKRS